MLSDKKTLQAKIAATFFFSFFFFFKVDSPVAKKIKARRQWALRSLNGRIVVQAGDIRSFNGLLTKSVLARRFQELAIRTLNVARSR